LDEAVDLEFLAPGQGVADARQGLGSVALCAFRVCLCISCVFV
jgi:hypothetical protein